MKEDIYSLHIDGIITSVNDGYYEDSLVKEFIVCGDIMEDYIDWIDPEFPPKEMPTFGFCY